MQRLALFFLIFILSVEIAFAETQTKTFDSDSALRYSQSAIGKTLGDYTFINRDGKPLSLKQFRGKPLIISLVFTTCFHICPTTTRHLAKTVDIAREALGKDSFSVVTIGFDMRQDTPAAMRDFAGRQGVDFSEFNNWYFLSAESQETIDKLTENLGFIYMPALQGFNHVVQATIVDAQGKIYRQVYGEIFDIPLLTEPLKALILGTPQPEQPFLTDLVKRVRFFCTVYDSRRHRYNFDYSIFVGMTISGLIILTAIVLFIREFLYSMRNHFQ